MATTSVPETGSTKKSRAIALSSEHARIVQSYASDPKYKKYTQQVEKCLNSFENVQEWADCIAFLKQLLKTFQAYMQFKEIPRKLVVAKRLSQCLNPALPTGVHQRALDVYAHILAVLGSAGLRQDLALWSSGLFPFFEYAATSVKPSLLNLFDTHYLPLQEGLRPIMKAFILALLPGLEEETSEFFEQVLRLLDRLSGTVSPSFFLQNVWLVLLTTPSARGTALNFLSRRLPRVKPDESISHIVGNDIGLMIRAFAATLEDENLLVRRSALDLLIQSLRMDSITVKRATPEDKSILMRAASGVVLRRDLSLNRRLYTWLLGSDDNSDAQVLYLRDHGLELLRSTLREDMFSPSVEYSESRPFKILISLMDKWEVGGPLMDALIYDAFRAVKKSAERARGGEDITMTASTLYEAVEPQALWRHLLPRVFAEIVGDGRENQGISLARFIVQEFRHDEEVRTVHFPLVSMSVAHVLAYRTSAEPQTSLTQQLPEVLRLLEDLILKIPVANLRHTPEVNASPYHAACEFYGISAALELPAQDVNSSSVFAIMFGHLVKASAAIARFVSSGPLPTAQAVLVQALVLIARMLQHLGEKSGAPLTVPWQPAAWLTAVLGCIEGEVATFAIIDRVVTLTCSLHQRQDLTPRLSISDRKATERIVSALWTYLDPEFAAYHVRAVNLIWSLESFGALSHVESVIARILTTSESRDVQKAHQAFGVLWRLTDDGFLPGFRLRAPMFIVLGTLRSDDPTMRRLGEVWMRCSLRSYVRVLDPILFSLLDPSIRRRLASTTVNGRELPTYRYEDSMDQRYIHHLLEILLSVVRFGGQGFTKTTRSTPARRTSYPELGKRLDKLVASRPDVSYLDVIVEVLLRYIMSEPSVGATGTMGPYNVTIQSVAIDILQALVSRGEVDDIAIQNMESSIIGKLYVSVHTQQLDLQNKLLHLLHSIISASNAITDARSNEQVRTTDGQNAPRSTTAVNPLLIVTLVDSISTSSNRPVLQHWFDFILMTIPQFQHLLQAAVGPLNDCVCRQLHATLQRLQRVSSASTTGVDIRVAVDDAEFSMLLGALERLVLLHLSHTPGSMQFEDENFAPDKGGSETSGGILGYVSTVFSTDQTHPPQGEHLNVRSASYHSLDEAVRVLYATCASLEWTDPPTWDPRSETLSVIYTRIRTRCRRVLEHLFRAHSTEVLESLIQCWSKTQQDTGGRDVTSFELVDYLASSAQTVVHMICESIMIRISTSADKSRKQGVNPEPSDSALFRFLEQYMVGLEGPLVAQVWGRFQQLTKEVLGNTREYKVQTFSTLRCFSVLASKLTQTTALEDRRLRKELQDTFSRLLDACVGLAGRDQGGWIRRINKEALTTNGRSSPIPGGAALHRVASENNMAEKLAQDSPIAVSVDTGPDLISQIVQYIATDVLSNLRGFLMDNDKIGNACNNIVYYIVNPATKGRSRPFDADDTVVNIIHEMTRIQGSLKVWRGPVMETLADNRVFNSTPNGGACWQPIVAALVDFDKTAFPELLGKVYTAPSANIFVNREYEMLLQSLNLRRLSYVLLAGEKNHFLAQLPSVQEKLVEIFRNVSSPVVQSEVYLCVRVLLCRLSPHNLTSFWPVILTELYRLFDQLKASVPADGSEELPLVLSACKCLDLLLTLQTQEFQIHQWIFITDTVDAVYRPDGWYPDALLDQLAEIAADLPTTEYRDARSTPQTVPSPGPATAIDPKLMRRPMLHNLRQIDSIRDLVPFFSSVSIASYESVYASSGTIDWPEVERSILEDMFDGR
ncbi:hypothetical protein PUNSTDRAFT_140678 [Punctularia strigosozonata HHB-11173 SS5]|uniref:uncharacterized protein n=1 Tax=Punctularia strigosozonata (strain HHB-11173) TaxID=741275 RepID=UPI0004417BA8|nr:uncharacterized protein PUNSTDRAFT_140678 [Punctularia strigosozonata HHB-11173 SS5]EIN14374.1 hypothetical protein PUNSTDRAFT_140678 [Punctularia strigosozonata HHB-11173 SS5]